MSEIKQLVNTYHVDMKCDKCGNGYMRTTGLVLPRNPILYEHKCTYCGCKENYSCAYPTIVTEKVIPLSKEVDEQNV